MLLKSSVEDILIPFPLRVCSRKLISLAFRIVSEAALSVEKSPVTSGNDNSDTEVDLELLRDEDCSCDPLPLYGG
eukprot:2490410-Rhodomonas_salina.1